MWYLVSLESPSISSDTPLVWILFRADEFRRTWKTSVSINAGIEVVTTVLYLFKAQNCVTEYQLTYCKGEIIYSFRKFTDSFTNQDEILNGRCSCQHWYFCRGKDIWLIIKGEIVWQNKWFPKLDFIIVVDDIGSLGFCNN